MKIGFFSTDWIHDMVPGRPRARYGGTCHYRMALPCFELAKHGFETVLSWSADQAPDGHVRVRGTDGAWHDDCDVVVFQRWMHVDGPAQMARARAAGQVVLQDVDDYFWAIPETNIASRTTDRRSNATFNRDNYRATIEASSGAICSTALIAGRLARWGVPTFVCRNAIDVERWEPHDPGEGGMVGWVGGVSWRGNDLPLLRGVLGPFLEEHGLPFYHGGHDRDAAPAWVQLGLDPVRTRVVVAPLTSVEDYPRLWDPVGLALVPIEASLFGRSKSWLKGLEAAACGLPFVASRLPEYELLGCGRLARRPSEWRDHLEALLDPAQRRVEGAANRARAEELSIGRQWGQWASVLDELGVGLRELSMGGAR